MPISSKHLFWRQTMFAKISKISRCALDCKLMPIFVVIRAYEDKLWSFDNFYDINTPERPKFMFINFNRFFKYFLMRYWTWYSRNKKCWMWQRVTGRLETGGGVTAKALNTQYFKDILDFRIYLKWRFNRNAFHQCEPNSYIYSFINVKENTFMKL